MSAALFPLEPTAAAAQAAIGEEFAFFGDWSERYQYLIDLGRKLPPFPDAWKTEQHRLHGCQSLVWIVPILAILIGASLFSLVFRGLHGEALVAEALQNNDNTTQVGIR